MSKASIDGVGTWRRLPERQNYSDKGVALGVALRLGAALKREPVLDDSEPAEALGTAPKGSGLPAMEVLFAGLQLQRCWVPGIPRIS